jgi:hypothetical protein
VLPSTNEELREAKDGFHIIANFPNVVGTIDGTLIPMQGMTIKKIANKQTNKQTQGFVSII